MPRLTRAASANIAASKAFEAVEDHEDTKKSSAPDSNAPIEIVPETQKPPPQAAKNDGKTSENVPSDELNEKNPLYTAPKGTSPATNPQSRTPKEPESTTSKSHNETSGPSAKDASDSYIPPNERRLGLHEHAINKPRPMLETTDLMDFELRKFVGLTVQTSAHNPSFSGEYLEEVSRLAAQFMDTFSATLRKLTDIQRHSLPGIADLQLCLEKLDITPTDVYQEYLRNQALPHPVRQQAARLRVEVENMLKDYYADKYDLNKDDPSLVFYTNEQYEIAALVPQQTKTRDYIPEYFPELPPDFTYRLTSSFMETMTELKKIKMKLFEESRLNEASLYKLIDDDEKRWLEELNEQLAGASDEESDPNEDIMSANGDHDSEVESPLPDLVLADKPAPESAADESQNVEKKEEPLKALEEKKSADELTVEVKGMVEPKEPVPAESGHEIDSLSGQKSADTVPPNDPLEPLESLAESAGNKIATANGHSSAPEPAKSNGENYFDIVAYAKKRRLALERPLKEIKRQQELRNKNYYLHAEKMFSSYAAGPPTPMDLAYVDGLLKKSFKNVIRATRRAEKAKQESLALMAAERERLEKANEKLHGTLEFAFNDASNFLDESDDNMDDEARALDFGDMSDVIEKEPVSAEKPEAELAESTAAASLTPSLPAEQSSLPSLESSLSASEPPQPNQVSGKMPMKSIPDENVDELDDGNDADNLDEMLEELELFQGGEWPEQAAEPESEEDELEDL